jgi:paraquat-inducible protein A
VPLLLSVSFVMNVIALFAPFMLIDEAFKPEKIYSLPRSVKLLLDKDLYVLATLVVAFSIVFPFVKLALLTVVRYWMKDDGKRRVLLHRLGPLGKWSFLDIYVICVVLVLANDQFLLSAASRPGAYFFIVAIGLSMTCHMILERLLRAAPVPESTTRRRLATPTGLRKTLWSFLLFAAFVTIVATVCFDYLKIVKLFLKSHAYSILKSVPTLWNGDEHAISLMVAINVIAFPVLYAAGLLYLWFVQFHRRRRRRVLKVVRTVQEWAMLDVFGLGLIVFLYEGQSLVTTEIKPGLWLIFVSIFLTIVTTRIVGRAVQRKDAMDESDLREMSGTRTSSEG